MNICEKLQLFRWDPPSQSFWLNVIMQTITDDPLHREYYTVLFMGDLSDFATNRRHFKKNKDKKDVILNIYPCETKDSEVELLNVIAKVKSC